MVCTRTFVMDLVYVILPEGLHVGTNIIFSQFWGLGIHSFQLKTNQDSKIKNTLPLWANHMNISIYFHLSIDFCCQALKLRALWLFQCVIKRLIGYPEGASKNLWYTQILSDCRSQTPKDKKIQMKPTQLRVALKRPQNLQWHGVIKLKVNEWITVLTYSGNARPTVLWTKPK